MRLRRQRAWVVSGAAFVLAGALGIAGCGSDDPAANLSPDAAAGRQIVLAKGCQGCHSPDGSRRLAPTFKGLWMSQVQLRDGSKVTADAAYIAESIRAPAAKVVNGYSVTMAPMDLSDADMAKVVAYIQSLG